MWRWPPTNRVSKMAWDLPNAYPITRPISFQICVPASGVHFRLESLNLTKTFSSKELAILRSRMPCTKRYDSTERGEVIQKLTFSYSRHYLLCTCITVHCRTHKSPPVDTPLTQISPVHFLLQPLTSIKKLQTFLLPMRATCSVSPTFLH